MRLSPLTGNQHITLKYLPRLDNVQNKKNIKLNIIKTGLIHYIHGNKRLEINDEHHYPAFIAKDVEELRAK